MLYKKNNTAQLDDKLFQNPTAEYRATPFWGWNGKLEKGILERQIGFFKEMGYGGFHMHSRTGLTTPYLSDEYMEMVKFCVETARDKDMLAWGYDEDRWPSGFGGGMVTSDKRNRTRDLLWTKEWREGFLEERPKNRSGESYLIGCYDIILDEKGYLKSYEMIDKDAEAKGEKWYAYNRIAADNPWFNNQAYVDTLYKPAIEKFVEVTHERYKEVVGEYFDTLIPSFFTDEPKVTYKKNFARPKDGKNLIMVWTDDLPETFGAKYSEDLVKGIPELFWELPDRISTIRYNYHKHIAERFTESYVDTIQDWCEENKINLSGHMIKEPTLKSQSTAIGEMELPLSHFGMPGIDMLEDGREYTTAKQAQSAAHQMGREGVLSELYGVTNWDFDFRRHKLAGDWQAALGVTVRAPHHAWMSMAGDSKRDYPASLSYQSPWYKEYALVENHFARLNTALTRGKCVVKVGMIHPVESMWMYFGTDVHTSDTRKSLDAAFAKVTEGLLFGQVDFDYIGESVLAEAGGNCGNRLMVGEMGYEAVVVAGCKTLRKTTVEYLKKFQENGGTIVFVGEVPEYMDACLSDEPKKLAEKGIKVPLEEQPLVESLERFRQAEVLTGNGTRHSKMLYQLREDGDDLWFFTCYGKKKERYDTEGTSTVTIRVKGEWIPVLYDTINGNICKVSFTQQDGWTYVNRKVSVHDSVLLKFTKNVSPYILEEEPAFVKENTYVASAGASRKVPVTLEEKNVCLMDLFEYKVDEEEYHPEEEILRIEDIVRAKCGLSEKCGAAYSAAQPWTFGKIIPEHSLSLKCRVQSEILLESITLALEHPGDTKIIWNGKEVQSEITGWYVDEQIKTVSLGKLLEGENVLELTFPLCETTNTESCYLLGDFGVRVEGTEKIITKPVKSLAFGDITTQGLPFYGGNIVYHMEVETGEEGLAVHAPYFRGSLIGITVDGERKGSIAFAPYTFSEKEIGAGRHKVDLTLFGNRVNTFGALHNCNENTTWFGPPAWRSKGDSFSYEYQFKKTGILKAPEIY